MKPRLNDRHRWEIDFAKDKVTISRGGLMPDDVSKLHYTMVYPAKARHQGTHLITAQSDPEGHYYLVLQEQQRVRQVSRVHIPADDALHDFAKNMAQSHQALYLQARPVPKN